MLILKISLRFASLDYYAQKYSHTEKVAPLLISDAYVDSIDSCSCPFMFNNVLLEFHFPFTVPIILVCNKVDLRFKDKTRKELAKHKQEPVTYKQGYAMAEKVGAFAYVECSAKLNQGVHEVFEAATRASLLSKKALRNAMYESIERRLQFVKTGKFDAESSTKQSPQRFRKLTTLS